MEPNRRQFLKATTLAAVSGILSPKSMTAKGYAKKTRVLVWDERADTEKEAYDHFLGNYIAEQLKGHEELAVSSAGLDDPDQGISEYTLDNTDVLLWWGHTRQAEITQDKAKSILERIKAGSLALIVLHSAHWSTAFMRAMNEITRRNVLKDPSVRDTKIYSVDPPQQFTVPKYDSRVTPYTVERKFPDGHTELQVHLPFCCFPAYRNDGKPSTVRVLRPEHPIMKGLPASFQLPKTEMYDEPFHVPPPDLVLFEECWEGGEWFRSGMLWKIGKGKICYFRPGHEAYPVYKDPNVMKILSNAVKWMAP